MNKLIKISIFSLLLSIHIFTQNYEYWNSAPLLEHKIYYVCFLNNNQGFAVSEDQSFFDLSGSAEYYKAKYSGNIKPKFNDDDILWSAEIFLSVMQTTDGGLSWAAYKNIINDKFYQVYLKNELTSYDVGEELLVNVIHKINDLIKSKNLDLINNHPIEYSEYYSSESEGWAVGWYVKSYNLVKEKINPVYNPIR